MKNPLLETTYKVLMANSFSVNDFGRRMSCTLGCILLGSVDINDTAMV